MDDTLIENNSERHNMIRQLMIIVSELRSTLCFSFLRSCFMVFSLERGLDGTCELTWSSYVFLDPLM